MIVNYCESGWQVITQRSHGLLAAQICAHWTKDNQPKRWIETLIACAEHDDSYNEFERTDLLTGNGGPKNFKMTSFVRQDAERLVDMAEAKSAYIALLISRHVQFVHGPDQRAKAFCRKLREREKGWARIADVRQPEIERSYQLLEFCDAFSLLLCQALIQPEQRSVEISNGPDGVAYTMHNTADGITVDPWPFDVPMFEVSYESRIIEQLRLKIPGNSEMPSHVRLRPGKHSS